MHKTHNSSGAKYAAKKRVIMTQLDARRYNRKCSARNEMRHSIYLPETCRQALRLWTVRQAGQPPAKRAAFLREKRNTTEYGVLRTFNVSLHTLGCGCMADYRTSREKRMPQPVTFSCCPPVSCRLQSITDLAGSAELPAPMW